MSCYIVSNETMKKVMLGVKITYEAYHCEEIHKEKFNKYHRSFILLNRKSVNYRYREKAKCNYKYYTSTVNDYERYSLIEIYKAVQELTYQCDEGNFMETKTGSQLKEIADCIAYRIISALPEYHK